MWRSFSYHSQHERLEPGADDACLALCRRQVYAALNALGEVGWCINQPMYDVVQSAYDQQLPICDLPRKKPLPMIAQKKAARFRSARTRTQLLAQVRDLPGGLGTGAFLNAFIVPCTGCRNSLCRETRTLVSWHAGLRCLLLR